jgi:DNA-binding MarR family transcriptional regulator
LLQLDPDHPVPTRALASMLGCDPSNVTPFVDRLEKAGLVERQVDPHDRRVKTLVVTTEGRAMLEQMNDIRGTDSPPLEALTPSERDTLEKLLGKAWTAAQSYEAEQCAKVRARM